MNLQVFTGKLSSNFLFFLWIRLWVKKVFSGTFFGEVTGIPAAPIRSDLNIAYLDKISNFSCFLFACPVWKFTAWHCLRCFILNRIFNYLFCIILSGWEIIILLLLYSEYQVPRPTYFGCAPKLLISILSILLMGTESVEIFKYFLNSWFLSIIQLFSSTFMWWFSLNCIFHPLRFNVRNEITHHRVVWQESGGYVLMLFDMLKIVCISIPYGTSISFPSRYSIRSFAEPTTAFF